MTASIQSNNISKMQGYIFHLLSAGIIITRLGYHLAYTDILHFLVILLIIVPPGIYLISSMNNIKMSFPFAIGAVLATGIIIQSLMYFLMTIANIAGYYKLVAFSVSVISFIMLFCARESKRFDYKESTYDFADLILYIGLFLGIGLFSSTYGNLFVSSVTEGLVASPLLERHTISIANYALNFDEYPFFSIFGWPFIPVEIPNKILHLPMSGFLVKSLSVWCNGNLLFGLYLAQLFVFLSLILMAGMICSSLFNKYAAILISVAFCLHFMPIDCDYLLYFPVLLSLMAAEVFILITINQDTDRSDINIRIIILMCIIIFFLLLSHNQFLMVFSSAFLVYILFYMSIHGFFKTMKANVFPIIFFVLAFYIALQQNKVLYPSLYATPWDQRRAVLEFGLFKNIEYLFPNIFKDVLSFFKTIFRYDFFFVIFGAMMFFKYLKSYKQICFKSTHVFIWSGIIISLLFGNIFNFEAGNSSILFLTFAIYFLFIYGGEALSKKPYIALILTSVIIIGFFTYPNFYRFWYCGNGSVPKQEYIVLRKISESLPANAKFLLVSDKFFNLYVGYADEPEPQNYDRRTQRTCEMIIGRRCVYQNYNENTDKSHLMESILKKIMTYKLTHIITDGSDNIFDQIGPSISIVNKKELSVSKDRGYYLAELKYNRHFL